MSNARGSGVSLADVVEPLNVTYYGDPGSGKTVNLASMAKFGRILFVNAEAGIKRLPLERRGVPVDNIEIWPPPGKPLTFEGLEEQYLRLAEEVDKKWGSWVGCCWDSATDIHQKLLESVVRKAVGQAERAGRERDRFVVERGDYGVMTEQMRQLMRRYRDLPIHFGMSALARREQDDDSSVMYLPAVTPGLQGAIMGYVDVVSYCQAQIIEGKDEYNGLFRPVGKFRGKDRYGVLPRGLVDPTFDRLVSYIQGDLDAESDPLMQEARAARDRMAQKLDGASTQQEEKTQKQEKKEAPVA